VSTFLFVLALSQADGTEDARRRLENELLAVLGKVRASVVQVVASYPAEPAADAETVSLSGVVWTGDGHVVTEASGVERAAELIVRSGEKRWRARFIAADRRSGVAVLKVDGAADLAPVAVAEGCPRQGSPAIAVGNAHGVPGGASFGRVSALGRRLMVAGRRFEDAIELTAPVQPGDAGACVADAGGRFIGLVHAVLPPGPAGEGSAFAIPVDWVRFSADRIVRHGRMIRGWLGLSARRPAPLLCEQSGLEENAGAEVTRVEADGPAKRAGIGEGDVIVSFDGEAVRDVDAFKWRVARFEQAKEVEVGVARGKERRSVKLQVEIDPQR
jgi:serine protease Do